MDVTKRFLAGAQVVALVEDEPVLREELAFQLGQHGLHVLAFADAPALYRHMATGTVQALVLDIGLPGEDGLSIARLLRAHNKQVGIVFLTARSQRDARLAGLQAGADAFFVKPVDLDELVLVLRRLLDRQLGTADSALQGALGPAAPPARPQQWMLDRQRALLVAPNGKLSRLSLVELQLLSTLVAQQGQACSYAALARGMGLMDDEWDRHRLEVIVSRLRQKIERETAQKAPIRTRRGEGYAWLADETPEE